jgi:hypothetical protein
LIDAEAALLLAQTLFLQDITENSDVNHFNVGSILIGNNVDPYSFLRGDYTVSSSVAVDLKANENITLKPGVQILSGSTFTARIGNFNGDCTAWNASMISPPIDDLESVHTSTKREIVHSKELEWKVYPNPFLNYLNLDILSVSNAEYNLTIYSTLGAIVYSENGHLDNNENKLSINTSDFVAGMYLIQLQVGENRYTKKIIHYEN